MNQWETAAVSFLAGMWVIKLVPYLQYLRCKAAMRSWRWRIKRAVKGDLPFRSLALLLEAERFTYADPTPESLEEIRWRWDAAMAPSRPRDPDAWDRLPGGLTQTLTREEYEALDYAIQCLKNERVADNGR